MGRIEIQRAKKLERIAPQVQNSIDQRHNIPDVALTRLIFAEARRRHVNRPTFQKRLCDGDAGSVGQRSGPTLWRLCQCTQILNEAMQDVLSAVKVWHAANAGLLDLQVCRAVDKDSSITPCKLRFCASNVA